MEQNNVLNTGLLTKEKPETICELNNGQGTFLYNHNVKEVSVVVDPQGGVSISDEDTEDKMYQYDSVRVEYPKTGDNIFSTLITAKYPANVERKLVNEYQSAVLGIMPKEAKKPYENFLHDRLAIRSMVDADCVTLNIPNDLQ